MAFLYAFIGGGLICVIGQLLIDPYGLCCGGCNTGRAGALSAYF